MPAVNKTTTYHQGALKQGTAIEDTTASLTVLSMIKTTLQAASAAAVSSTITLPPNSQIVEIFVDSTVAWTATGAVTFTAGTAAAGTQYITSIDLKTVTRGSGTRTAAQLAAMQDIGTNTSLVVTATTASGANAVGTTIVTVLVAQTK